MCWSSIFRDSYIKYQPILVPDTNTISVFNSDSEMPALPTTVVNSLQLLLL